MKWFGHLIRLLDNTTAIAALKYLNEKAIKPRG